MPPHPDSLSLIFKITLVYFCVWKEKNTYAMDRMWGSEDNMLGSALSYYVDYGDQTQVVCLGGKRLSPGNHLYSPVAFR